ncbi:MAG: UDP-glucose 6-dehydrogenase [Flavobacteriia bacterium]|nr:MAG: UDP-glucose 6-dehydrogenase [Flavobacteriia bacterium]
MTISVIGSGYVGLVTGTCFAEMGNRVICVDIDEQKIERLKKGIIPIYEKGLGKMVVRNIDRKNLFFTTSLESSLTEADIVFIAVGTPMGEDGSADLSHVKQVAREIGNTMIKDLWIVNKSTVPVGTSKVVANEVQEALDQRGVNYKFEVISNPEFLKEGDAVADFMQPDRVVVGAQSQEAIDVMHRLYKPFMQRSDRFIAMDTASSEMTKYASNAMLATKISFMNEMANICERVGANVNMVRLGIGSDSRIGYSFIYAGAGYGGSCFPKDVQALIKTAHQYDYTPKILEAVEEVNYAQKQVLGKKIIQYFGADLKGKTIAVWGLAFKPGTDDMREASAITLIKSLTAQGAKVVAYDPEAMDMAKSFYLKDQANLEYAKDKYECIDQADALVLVTEWKEFRSPDFDLIKGKLKSPVIFDGRNQYDAIELHQQGFIYFQIGVAE